MLALTVRKFVLFMKNIYLSDEERVHGPQPHNPISPYFPPQTVALCKKEFIDIMLRFRRQDIEFFKQALICGEVNGCNYKSDLVGTLAQALNVSISDLRSLLIHIEKPPFRGSMSEYWIGQIIGPYCASHKPHEAAKGHGNHICQFVDITIDWCDEALRELDKANIH